MPGANIRLKSRRVIGSVVTCQRVRLVSFAAQRGVPPEEVARISAEQGDMLAGMVVQVPAVWVIIALTVTVFGLAPKFSTAGWAIGSAALLISMFGPIVNVPQVVLDISPFQHPPKLPGQPFAATPLLWLLLIAAVALAAGLVGWRRRDVG